MPRLQADAVREQPAGQQKPDPVAIVRDALVSYLNAHSGECLPPPLPVDPTEAARWWVAQMQEPERKGETYIAPCTGAGEGVRWECGHAVRCRQALAHWLAMPDDKRQIVVRLVQDGHVYRGESFDRFMAVAEQREQLREIGLAAYRQRSIQATKRALGSINQARA
jgi:hypothetical protein